MEERIDAQKGSVAIYNGGGLKVNRVFTKAGEDPLNSTEYEMRTSTIRNPDGSVVFELRDIEIPRDWTQVATDILAQKYFRKTGVPQYNRDGSPVLDENGQQVLGSEKSIKQVAHRMAGCWRYWGEKYNYFASEADAQAYEDEMTFMLIHQMAAPNSPQWFNTGLAHAYGITGTPQGHWYADPSTGELHLAPDAYTRVVGHACFIQSVNDDLVNEGGIFDLVTREARIFKYGSGTGSNFSALRARGEKLSGGGASSGLMSFLKIFDYAAGSIKSGGTTRRAAKMVILNADHPEIEEFVTWKAKEEAKVADLYTGSRINYEHLNNVMRVAREEKTTNWKGNEKLRTVIAHALKDNVPFPYVVRALQLAEQGVEKFDLQKFDTHYESEAYTTVSGQNSNNSVRLPNAFMEAAQTGGKWELTARTTGKVMRTINAGELLDKIAFAAWSSADPGVQFDDTIQEWHTSPVDGRINATNPCVTGDTKVMAKDGRWYRIDNLIEKETELITNLNSISIGVTKGAFKTGTKPVYKLETASGYEVKLTADHLVYTANRGFVQAAELTKDDYICLPAQPVAEVKQLPEEQARLYQLLGLYLGDGCGSHNQIQITMEKNAEEPVLQAIANYCTANFTRNTHQTQAIQVKQTATSAKLHLGAISIVEKIAQFVDLSQKSHEKTISPAVFALSLSEQKYLLQGLFTADGTVADYGEKSQYIALDSTSLQLIKDVQVLLSGFGIKSKIYYNRRAGKNTAMLPDGKGGLQEYEVKEVHSLRISRSSRLAFEKLIGFMQESPKAIALKKLNERVSVYNDAPYDAVTSLDYIGEQEVFDLTEPLTQSFIANGISVHNCSEYVYLDDTACNLASINLMKFYNGETNQFEVEKFIHATRLWTITLEITVLMAGLPSKEIARKTFETRTLGLGYANLGTLLMVMGIPYNSDEGRAIAGAITAMLTGESYATSAEMAGYFGAFKAYERNREHMLKVIRNHRRAAYNVPENEYEKLTIKPIAINPAHCPDYLLVSARDCWDRALQVGEINGYRNAQVTVLAPTGTIGLVMDCDTTGIEPDFAIVKFKKLAGGGYFKIVNQSVPQALQKLNYSEQQNKEIEDYCKGRGTFIAAPHINLETLRKNGFTQEKLDELERQAPTAFDISFIFNKFTLGEDFCVDNLGFKREELTDSKFNMLEALGFTKEQIREANDYVCGTMTIEGAPHLKPEHYPIFDCANRCGKYGKRYIQYDGHIKMMAAVQPFISGSMSKTINMPNEATIAEVKEAYTKSWKYMIKAMALYRDGSKLSQPLNATAEEEHELLSLIGKEDDDIDERVDAKQMHELLIRGQKKRLPAKRGGITQEARIGGHKLFFRTGEYQDGTIGEIFIDMYKEGASYRSLLNCFAIAVSKGLQYGVPLEEFIETFNNSRFEPSGVVIGDESIKNATSIIDYAFRVLEREYLAKQSKTIIPDSAHTTITFEAQAEPHRAIDDMQTKLNTSSTKESTPDARAMGFTGEQCGKCGSMKVKRNGACSVCVDCGETTGCS